MAVSALLRSAQAAQKKVRQNEDAIAAYEWENSAQTYDDFLRYSSLIDKRLKDAVDTSEALTYSGKLRSARRSYTSNEIQRSAIAIMEGRGSLQDKQNTVYNLAQQAAENGDMNLVQNLVSQYDSLSIQIQNEAEKAQRLAATMAANKVKDIKSLVDAQKRDLKTLGQQFQQIGADEFNKRMSSPEVVQELAAIPHVKQLLDAGGQIGFWDIAKGIADNIQQTYQDAIDVLPQEDSQALRDELDKITSGEASFNIPGVGKVSALDLQKQADAVRAGGTYFYQGPNNTMEKGNLTNYTWAKDAQGKYSLIEQYAQRGTETNFGDRFNPNQRTGDAFDASLVFMRNKKGELVDRNSNKVLGRMDEKGNVYDIKGNIITDEARKNEVLKKSTVDYEALLTNAGFTVNKTDGKLRLIPGQNVSGRFKELGIQDGAPVEAVVDPQGNLRFVKQKPDGSRELYQIGFDNKGQAYTQKLLEGGQGAVSALDYEKMRQDFQKYQPNTPFGGLNAGRQSLINSSELIARGENFRYGKLAYDMEQRRAFLESLKAEPMQLNPVQSAVTKIAQPIDAAVKKISQKITSTPGMDAANRSLTAAVQAASQPAKYGVLRDPVRQQSFVQSLKTPEPVQNRNFAQKLAGFFGF